MSVGWRATAELVEQRLEARVVAVVEDDEAGVDVPGRVVGVDADRVRVPADVVARLVDDDLVLGVQQMRGRQPRDARSDDGDPHETGVRTPGACGSIDGAREPCAEEGGAGGECRRGDASVAAGCRRRRRAWRRRRRCRRATPPSQPQRADRGRAPRPATRPAPITRSRAPSERREHGRRRAVGADPAARDRSRRGEQRDADERAARAEGDRHGGGAHRATLTSASTVQRAMRTLGATGLPVSPLGLGLAALGRPGYINLGHDGDVGDTDVDAMERHAHEVLDAAYEGGVRYFDAARSYGRAEAFLASWLEAPRPLARRRHRRLEVGLHLHGRLARRRRRARGQGPLGRHAAPPARRDARAARRSPRALPDPLGHARERRARRRARCATSSRACARRASSSASPPPGRARPTRSSARWRSAASTPCRRPGTCTSARPPPRWPPRTTPGWA